ncbi:unnamed protein product [Diabrotica balteata]|uniref:Uncharacterized protein n=1 Tax=Diabrotica balteata TaxID=107213 RepID=A0A9N9T2U1_DIABA|nr:unnamed protein product [Diabrotica balteata]
MDTDKDCKLIQDETQKMMELLEHQMEEISCLEENIRKNENHFKNLESSVKDFKVTVNKNFANFENRTILKTHLEDMNKEFMSAAQTLYATIIPLTKVIEVEDSKMNEMSKKIEENEGNYNVIVEKVKEEKNKLLQAIEDNRKINFEKEKSRKSLVDENDSLKLELESLNIKIKEIKEKLDPLNSKEDAAALRTDITRLNIDNEKLGKEILELETFRQAKIEKLTEKGIIPTNLTERYKEVSQLQDELKTAVNVLETSLLEQKSSETLLFELDGELKKTENELETLRANADLNEIESIENRFAQEIQSYGEILYKHETRLTLNKNLDMELTQKIEAYKNDINLIDSDIQMLETTIKTLEERPDEDIYQLMKSNEEYLEELTSKHNNLNEEHFVCLTKKQEQFQTLITELETENKNKDEYIKSVDNEIKDILDQIVYLGEEKATLENELKELEKQLHAFRIPKPVKKASVAPVPPKAVRRWDSDTSVESEDCTRLNNFLKKAKIVSKK